MAKPILLLSYPRTASNLLMRILNLAQQPNIMVPNEGGYFFITAPDVRSELGNWAKPVQDLSTPERDAMMTAYQRCADHFTEFVDAATSAGKRPFVKEHTVYIGDPTNHSRRLFGAHTVAEPPWTVSLPGREEEEDTAVTLPPGGPPGSGTLLPDQFLRGWQPVILIRHPALAFPSHFQTYIDIVGINHTREQDAEMTLMFEVHPSRTLYDWYVQQAQKSPGVPDPVVLDADDIINAPEVVCQLCDAIGLDRDKVLLTWDVDPPRQGLGEIDMVMQRMRDTLMASTGIIRTKTSSSDIDIAAEAEKWKATYGEADGRRIEEWVRKAMPDYDYLRSKRLMPGEPPSV